MTSLPVTFGRYRLLERLGGGGMAEVFRAKSYGASGFEKVVVIKRILPELARRKEFVDVFIHEAKLAVRLSHANVVQVFDLGTAAWAGQASVGTAPASQIDAYYMALEYVRGIDLGALLGHVARRGTRMPAALCAFIGMEVAKGLDHAHRRKDDMMRSLNIVHRDLSPQNILLSFEGEVKVSDFGIATADEAGFLEGVQEDTQSRKLHGKFAYMSPEQARGEAATAASDLFALGVVLYEALTGVNPFQAPSTFETLRRVQACEFEPLLGLRPDAPAALVAVVEQCLQPLANRRFADAGKVHEALLGYLALEGQRCSAPELAAFMEVAGAGTPASQGVPLADDAALAPALASPAALAQLPALAAARARLEAEFVVARAPEPLELNLARDAEHFAPATYLALRSVQPDADLVALLRKIAVRFGGHVVFPEECGFGAVFGAFSPAFPDAEVAAQAAVAIVEHLASRAELRVALCLVAGQAEIADGRIVVDSEATRALAGLAESNLQYAFNERGATTIVVADSIARTLGLRYRITRASAANEAGGWLLGAPIAPAAPLPFRGRDAEMAVLADAIKASKSALRQLAIVGVSGIGKSRFVAEAEARLLPLCPGAQWLIADLESATGSRPLFALHQLAAGILKHLAAERVAPEQQKAAALLDVFRTEDDSKQLAERLLAATAADSDDPGPEAIKLVSRLLLALAKRGPTAIVWDVAEAMDAETQAVMNEVHVRFANEPLLVVEVRTSGGAGPSPLPGSELPLSVLPLLELGPLPDTSIEQLAESVFAASGVPDSCTRWVASVARGNVRIAEHAAHALLFTRALTVFDGRVVSHDEAQLASSHPRSWYRATCARYRALAPASRAVLAYAAAATTPFRLEACSAGLRSELANVRARVAKLAAEGWLRDATTGLMQLQSEALRRLVLDFIATPTACMLHACAGLGLVQEAAPGGGASDAEVAYHLAHGGAAALAAFYAADAGAAELASGKPREALEFLLSALAEQLAQPAEPAPILWVERITQALLAMRDLSHLWSLVLRVEQLMCYPAVGAVGRHARLAAAMLLARGSWFERAAQVLEELGAAQPSDPPNFALLRLEVIAQIAAGSGRHRDALAIYSKLDVQQLAPAGRARVALAIAVSLATTGKLAEAFEQSALAAVQHGFALGADEVALARGAVLFCGRDVRAATASFEAAADAALAAEHAYEAAFAFRELAMCFVREGNPSNALGALTRSFDICREHGLDALAERNQLLFAYLAPKALEELIADSLGAEADKAASKLRVGDEIFARWLLGRHLLRRREHELARAQLARAEALGAQHGIALLQQDCHVMLEGLGGPTVLAT